MSECQKVLFAFLFNTTQNLFAFMKPFKTFHLSL